MSEILRPWPQGLSAQSDKGDTAASPTGYQGFTLSSLGKISARPGPVRLRWFCVTTVNRTGVKSPPA